MKHIREKEQGNYIVVHRSKAEFNVDFKSVLIFFVAIIDLKI